MFSYLSIFCICQYVENVEQTKADICEIYLIIQEFLENLTASTVIFSFFPETARNCYNRFANATKGTVLIEYKGNKEVSLAKKWNNQAF